MMKAMNLVEYLQQDAAITILGTIGNNVCLYKNGLDAYHCVDARSIEGAIEEGFLSRHGDMAKAVLDYSQPMNLTFYHEGQMYHAYADVLSMLGGELYYVAAGGDSFGSVRCVNVSDRSSETGFYALFIIDGHIYKADRATGEVIDIIPGIVNIFRHIDAHGYTLDIEGDQWNLFLWGDAQFYRVLRPVYILTERQYNKWVLLGKPDTALRPDSELKLYIDGLGLFGADLKPCEIPAGSMCVDVGDATYNRLLIHRHADKFVKYPQPAFNINE